jgi:hypothetical protein
MSSPMWPEARKGIAAAKKLVQRNEKTRPSIDEVIEFARNISVPTRTQISQRTQDHYDAVVFYLESLRDEVTALRERSFNDAQEIQYLTSSLQPNMAVSRR